MASLTAQPLAPDSPATEAALHALHITVDDPLPPWLDAFTSLTHVSLPLAQVTAAIRSASRLSSAGPGGQSFEHLRNLFLGGDGLTQFGELCSIIASGLTPPTVAPLLAASTLIPLAKPRGGVRPIAIGECLYRVVARALLFEHREALRCFFSPDQFAVAIPAGCEALVLGARCLADIHPTHGFLQLDVANAINTIFRSSILESLRDSPLDALFPFVRSFYSFAAPLYYVCRASRRVITLHSSTGTRQGDPLSGAFFAFGLRRALAWVQARIPAALICTYADDTMVHGPPEVLQLSRPTSRRLLLLASQCRSLSAASGLLLAKRYLRSYSQRSRGFVAVCRCSEYPLGGPRRWRRH